MTTRLSGLLPLIGSFVLLASLAGCGPEAGTAPPRAAGDATSGAHGIVIAARPAVARDGGAALAATEITVRSAAGQEWQVVQADDPGLRPGDRVTVVPGSPTRLIRAP